MLFDPLIIGGLSLKNRLAGFSHVSVFIRRRFCERMASDSFGKPGHRRRGTDHSGSYGRESRRTNYRCRYGSLEG